MRWAKDVKVVPLANILITLIWMARNKQDSPPSPAGHVQKILMRMRWAKDVKVVPLGDGQTKKQDKTRIA